MQIPQADQSGEIQGALTLNKQLLCVTQSQQQSYFKLLQQTSVKNQTGTLHYYVRAVDIYL